MKRAYVYFWDGFRFGPRIDTHDEELSMRIKRIVIKEPSLRPSVATALFLAYDYAEGRQSEVWNASPARTTGQYVQAAESEGEWPRQTWGESPRVEFPQAGVFIVNTVSSELRIIGGLGFSKSEEECNPRALREMQLQNDTEGVL